MQFHSISRVAFIAALFMSSVSFAADTQELEEIVITASPIGDADALAIIAGAVGRDQLLRRGGGTLADALVDVPGVSASTFAAGASRPVIRGFDANRVRILEDGVGTFDVSDIGPDHGVPLDPLAAQRVEIVRGAATLRYGSKAIGGVVNSISNRVPSALPEDGFNSDLAAGLNSNGAGWDVAAQLDGRAGPMALHADGFARRKEDYDTPGGPMENSWARSTGISLGGSWIGEPGRAGLGAVNYQSRYGIPGESSWIDMEQTKLLLRSKWARSAGALESIAVDGGWADYQHDEVNDEEGVLSTFRDREWDLRAEALLGKQGVFSESALGAQLQDRDFSALGEGGDFMFPAGMKSVAVFGFTEARLAARLNMQLGARVEYVDMGGTPVSGKADRSFTPLSASIGLVLDASESTRLGFTLSSAARAPALTELFARGPHDAPATYEIGDPGLDTERANSLEATVRWRRGRVHADGAIWMTRFDHFIHGELTGRNCDEEGLCEVSGEGELRELYFVQRGAKFSGAEAHADIDLLQAPAGRLQLNLLADYVRARLDDGAGDVPRIPPWRAGVGLDWQAVVYDASIRLRYSGRQDHFGAFDTPTGGFANLDAQLSWRPWGESGAELALVGRNLTDRVQRNAAAFNKDEILLPGRDIRLMIRARLGLGFE
jgi:iron complex outermembrane recepter protein